MLYSPRYRYDALLAALDDDEACGGWPRARLLEMDDQFVARVEAAFEAGLESRAAAGATVWVSRSGVIDVEQVIEAAWRWFVSNRDEMDIPFAAIIARCPGVDPLKIRAGFEKRFANGGGGHATRVRMG